MNTSLNNKLSYTQNNNIQQTTYPALQETCYSNAKPMISPPPTKPSCQEPTPVPCKKEHAHPVYIPVPVAVPIPVPVYISPKPGCPPEPKPCPKPEEPFCERPTPITTKPNPYPVLDKHPIPSYDPKEILKGKCGTKKCEKKKEVEPIICKEPPRPLPHHHNHHCIPHPVPPVCHNPPSKPNPHRPMPIYRKPQGPMYPPTQYRPIPRPRYASSPENYQPPVPITNGPNYGNNFGTNIGANMGNNYGINLGNNFGNNLGTNIGNNFGMNLGTDFGNSSNPMGSYGYQNTPQMQMPNTGYFPNMMGMGGLSNPYGNQGMSGLGSMQNPNSNMLSQLGLMLGKLAATNPQMLPFVIQFITGLSSMNMGITPPGGGYNTMPWMNSPVNGFNPNFYGNSGMMPFNPGNGLNSSMGMQNNQFPTNPMMNIYNNMMMRMNSGTGMNRGMSQLFNPTDGYGQYTVSNAMFQVQSLMDTMSQMFRMTLPQY